MTANRRPTTTPTTLVLVNADTRDDILSDDAPDPEPSYAVLVGNVGAVWAGESPAEGRRQFYAWRKLSRGRGAEHCGRALGEPVMMIDLVDGGPVLEYCPPSANGLQNFV